MSDRPAASRQAVIRRVGPTGQDKPRSDGLATEEPLEIRIEAEDLEMKANLTMRTPGNDFELAVGYLYGESVLAGKQDLLSVRYCQPRAEQQYNVVTVDLRGPMPDTATLDRNFYSNGGCGVCGKANLDQLATSGLAALDAGPSVGPGVVLALPARLHQARRLLARTHGVQAAGMFDQTGHLQCVREDVDPENAMDKLVGWALMQERLPMTGKLVMVSARASFELVRKALRAGVSILCTDSPPSTLAVDAATRFGMTLIRCEGEQSFDVYTGESRVGIGVLLTGDPADLRLAHPSVEA